MSALTDYFTSLANKIRTKTGKSTTLTPTDMVSEIDDVYSAGQANPPTQTKSATPTTSEQTITPDSGKFLSSVSIGAISPDRTTNSMIVPRWGTNPGSNVPATQVVTRNPRIDFGNSDTYGSAEVVEIAMPAGYYAWDWGYSSCCIPTETQTVTADTSAKTVVPTNYNTGSQYVKYLRAITVNPTPSQEKTADTYQSYSTVKTVTPDSGKLLSKVNIPKAFGGSLSLEQITSNAILTFPSAGIYLVACYTNTSTLAVQSGTNIEVPFVSKSFKYGSTSIYFWVFCMKAKTSNATVRINNINYGSNGYIYLKLADL